MITTSNFRLSWSHPNAVAICRFPPRNWKGRRYKDLAPGASELRASRQGSMSQGEFAAYYRRKLERLDAKKVYEDLGPDAVLLCYEAPGKFCHRRLVAQWLENEFGIWVPELDPPSLFQEAADARMRAANDE